MAEAHLDHPGDVSWFVGHGPAPVLGPCPHTQCKHLGISNIAWGPDWEHYTLNTCDEPPERSGCDGQCRGWMGERPAGMPGPQYVWPRRWVQVDVSREHRTTREERVAAKGVQHQDGGAS